VFVTNHVLSGFAIGQLLSRHPVAAFAVGVASHLALDAIPHWGCDRKTPDGYRQFLHAARIDGLVGLSVAALGATFAGRDMRTATVAAMAGAVLFDVDKPAEHFLGIRLFPRFVNKLHGRIQKESPDGFGRELAWGFTFVGLDATAAVLRRSAGKSRRSLPFSGGDWRR